MVERQSVDLNVRFWPKADTHVMPRWSVSAEVIISDSNPVNVEKGGQRNYEY